MRLFLQISPPTAKLFASGKTEILLTCAKHSLFQWEGGRASKGTNLISTKLSPLAVKVPRLIHINSAFDL